MELLLPRIERVAGETPELTAITFGNQSWTYRDLMSSVRRLQSSFARLGIVKGDVVALPLADSSDFVLSHLSLMRLGAVSMPLHPKHAAADIERILTEHKPVALIADRASISRLGHENQIAAAIPQRLVTGDVGVVGWDSVSDLLSQGHAESEAVLVEEQDSAAVVFTSGVTGFPCGVELTQFSFAHQAHQLGRTLRVRTTDRMLCANGFSNINGLTLGIHLPLAHGATICVHDAAQDWETNLVQSTTSILIGPPQVFQQLAELEDNAPDLAPVRHLLCTDSRLRSDVRSRFEQKYRRQVSVGYATTETCGLVALNLFPHEENRDTVGEPLSDCEIAILNENDQRLGATKSGRIALRSPALMKGYRNAPEKTAEVLNDGWLLTTDFGSLDYLSQLNLMAAACEHILKGGFSVNAADVEDILREHPLVKDVAVVGITDAVYGEDLKACVTLKNGSNLSASELIQFAKEHTQFYKCPRIVKFYKELPQAPGGKIKRALLREEKS